MSLWLLGFVAGAIVVLLVAALLFGILQQARRILKLARTASAVVAEIDANTRSVWALAETNRVAGEILDGARAIDDNAAAIARAAAHDRDQNVA